MRFGPKRKPAKLSRPGSTGGARAEFHVFFVLRALLVYILYASKRLLQSLSKEILSSSSSQV